MADTFKLDKNGYIQFDAATLDQYIKDRLNASTNTKFTDHNFEGSYFSTVIEVISYVYNVLMFYLNQTSTESKFTDAQLYENINRIVKLIGYNPLGPQTSVVAFTANSTIATPGLYYIPRYSYINAGGTTYSFNEDLVFQNDSIGDAAVGKLLYQGKFVEYPLYTAYGQRNEIVFLTPGDSIVIDHFNIDVYVKSAGAKWEKWERVDSLVSKTASDKCFEVRFNENGRYELKFGNGINGKLLGAGDSVAIYYLKSDGIDNEIIEHDLVDTKYIRFASAQFTQIFNDISQYSSDSVADASKISFDNDSPSTSFSDAEQVESIRANAPDYVKRKSTLSKVEDYDSHILLNFSNLVSDVKTFNNFDYTRQYLDYFRQLGVAGANSVSRILYNQAIFADACNFNNMYIFVKPKIYDGTLEDFNKFLPVSLKQRVINDIDNLKLPSIEPIIMDPVYMAVGIGLNSPTDSISITDTVNSKLVVIKKRNSLRNNDNIKQDVNNVFLEYFDQDNTTFGMTIDFPEITNRILQVDGVSDFRVTKIDGSEYFYEGLSLVMWNPIYTNDIQLLLRSETLKDFQVPYLKDRNTFINNIEIITER
jgi:hypothetical protein